MRRAILMTVLLACAACRAANAPATAAAPPPGPDAALEPPGPTPPAPAAPAPDPGPDASAAPPPDAPEPDAAGQDVAPPDAAAPDTAPAAPDAPASAPDAELADAAPLDTPALGPDAADARMDLARDAIACSSGSQCSTGCCAGGVCSPIAGCIVSTPDGGAPTSSGKWLLPGTYPVFVRPDSHGDLISPPLRITCSVTLLYASGTLTWTGKARDPGNRLVLAPSRVGGTAYGAGCTGFDVIVQ